MSRRDNIATSSSGYLEDPAVRLAKPREMRQPRAIGRSEWLVLAFLVLASIPPELIRPTSLKVVPPFSRISMIDASWLLDTSYKAAGDIWFGRDVAFTYGPLFQWLSSAPASGIGISTGAIFATWYTLPLLVVIVATFFTARLLLPEAAPWRRALLVLLAVVFWSPPDVRLSVTLLAFAVFVRTTEALASGGRTLRCALGLAAICAAAFWLSADTGLYTCTAFLLCVGATAIATRDWTRMATMAIAAAIGFAGLMLLTNSVLASVLDFRFWRSSLAIAGGYRWFEPSAMSQHDKRILFGVLAMGIAAFSLAWRGRAAKASWMRRPAFLLAGFCLGFVMLQSALVRSDHVHVLLGLYPMIFLCGAVAMAKSESHLESFALPLIVIVATLIFASPYPLFRPGNILSRCRLVLHPMRTCPAGTAKFDGACLSPTDAQLLSRVSSYVASHTGPGEQIAVFPYQNLFGIASRRQVAGGVLQSYLVNGEYLAGLDLDGLRRSRPSLALYLPDGGLSLPIDGIPNFTRSPEVWLYLLQHYRTEGSPVTGALGLTRDDGREARLSFTEKNIGGRMGPIRVRKRNASIDLSPLRLPASNSDFLKLRLRADYPAWWRVRKPSKLILRLSLAGGMEKSVQFIVEPNRTSDIWVYPGDEQELGAYFSDDEARWRSGGRPEVTGLTLLVAPYDWLSVAPESVTIESIAVVHLKMKAPVGLAAQKSYCPRKKGVCACSVLPRGVVKHISADANHNSDQKPFS